MMKSFDTDDGRGRYHRLDQPEEDLYINRDKNGNCPKVFD